VAVSTGCPLSAERGIGSHPIRLAPRATFPGERGRIRWTFLAADRTHATSHGVDTGRGEIVQGVVMEMIEIFF